MKRLLSILLRKNVAPAPAAPTAKAAAGAKRRITSAKVTHVSLVSRGANKLPVLMKSGGRVEFSMLFKASEDEGLLHALVYVPEENGAVDTEGDVAPRSVVKQMAHGFIANGAHLDIEHDLNVLPAEQASVAETFLVQKGDKRFEGWVDNYGKPVDATDAWAMVIKLSDPGLRKAVKDGRIAGVSLFGLAEVEPITKSTSILEDMNEAQLKALLDQRDAALLEAITKAVAPKAPVAPAPVTPPAPPALEVVAIKFEGNPLDPKAVAAHKEKLFLASLDLSKSADVEKLETYLAAKTAKPAPGAAPSNQPAGDPPAPVTEKTEAELMKAGSEFGKKVNKLAGRV